LEKAAETGNAAMGDYAYLYEPSAGGLRQASTLGEPRPTAKTASRCWRLSMTLLAWMPGEKKLYMLPIGKYLKNDYLAKSCASAGK